MGHNRTRDLSDPLLLQLRSNVAHRVTTKHLTYYLEQGVSRNAVVGTAIRYRLQRSGVRHPRMGKIMFSSRQAVGPTQSPVHWVQGVKRPGCGVDHPPLLSPKRQVRKSYTSASALYLHVM
jgi:hypothetical protein